MSTFTHNPPYRLTGETGKTFNFSVLSLEDYGIETARLTLRSHGVDELTWFHRGDNVPDWMQEVTLLDASGTRLFCGNVTAVDPEWDAGGQNGWNVTVSGPWWWLEQAQLTKLTTADDSAPYRAPVTYWTVDYPVINGDDPAAVTITCPTYVAGTHAVIRYTTNGVDPTTGSTVYSTPITATDGMTIKAKAWWTKSGYASMTPSGVVSKAFTTRPTFGCPAQNLGTSITSLMNLMQGLGVPLRIGNISTTFTFMQMAFQGSTGAGALCDMLDAIPDAMTAIRYGVSGLPYLDIIRRDPATVTTLALGTDTDLTGPPIHLKARRELRPSYVTVASMVLAANGEVSLVNDTAGDGAGATGALGKQYIALSGTGARAYTSAVALDKATFLTIPATSAYLIDHLYKFHPGLHAALLKYGTTEYELVTSSVSVWQPQGDGWVNITCPPFQAWWQDGVENPSISGWHAVHEGTVPDWWEETGYRRARIKVRVRCTALAYFSSGPYVHDGVSDYAAKYNDLKAISSWFLGVSGGEHLYADLDIEFDAITADCSTVSTFVRPRDAFLVTPVANLADNLFAAQAFVPYDGTVPLLPGSVIPTPGNVVSITGGLSAWGSMESLVSAAEINLADGSASLTLGLPARQSANALVDRFSRATSGRVVKI